MKLLLKTLCLLVFLTTASEFARSEELPKVNMKFMEGKNALLEIEHVNNALMEITIQNKEGEIIYYNQTVSKSHKYQQACNLAEYKPSVYNLTVTSNNLVTEHQFSVSGKSGNFDKKPITQKPFFAFNTDENIVKIAYLNFPGEKMKLKVYEGNDLIFTKALDNSFSVIEGLNLSELEAGKYQVVLDAGTKDFNYPVVIR